MRYILALFLVLVSCAPKVCPPPEEVLAKVSGDIPRNVKLYGHVKAGFLRIPFALEKRGEEESVRIAQPGVSISSSSLCFGGACFELPVSPSELIYGRFEGDFKVVKCDGELVLRSEDGKEIVIEGGKLKAFKYKDLTVLYGDKSPEGFYEELKVILGDIKLSIYVEGAERWEVLRS
ncbi:MAG: hypothetical protein GXO04_02305 [Aquificae bacterium]|nr:hypothetical protein [Aquificota bacterium]